MQLALQARLDQTPRLADRSQYLGASEVGSCLRRVVCSKLFPEPLDQASMGRMLAGKAMEAIGRNPEAAPKIQSAMILAMAFAEAIAIYALVIALIIKLIV